VSRTIKVSLLIALFFAFAHTPLLAGQSTYNCIVKDVREVSDNGIFKRQNGLRSAKVGMMFVIEKRTGRVVGEYINSDGMEPDVLDKGGGNNFKVLNMKNWDPSFREIFYIEVMDSINNAPFAFIGFRFSETFSGICN